MGKGVTVGAGGLVAAGVPVITVLTVGVLPVMAVVAVDAAMAVVLVGAAIAVVAVAADVAVVAVGATTVAVGSPPQAASMPPMISVTIDTERPLFILSKLLIRTLLLVNF